MVLLEFVATNPDDYFLKNPRKRLMKACLKHEPGLIEGGPKVMRKKVGMDPGMV